MKLLMALFAVLAVSACGPKYVTDYDLFPPPSAEGKQCVAQCEIAKERCEKKCYQDALQCEKFNDYPYGGVGGWNNGVGVGVGFPLSGRSCNSVSFCEQSCREDHLACHKACGGTVVAREPRCVSHCPDEP